jgi:hypothetical protein
MRFCNVLEKSLSLPRRYLHGGSAAMNISAINMTINVLFISLLEIYDTTWLIIYITYIILFLVYPSREIVRHQLPVASSLIVLLEQVSKF